MLSLQELKPLPLGKTILFFTVPAIILYVTHYHLVPAYVVGKGVAYLNGYLVGYVVTMGFFVVATLVAYLMEGNPVRWTAFRRRYRLRRMDKIDWLWTVMLIIFVLITYFGLSYTGEWVRSVPLLAPRGAWPTEFGPGAVNNFVPGEFMGLPLHGQWWVVLVYTLGWFFNIFGEELWFRGYLLPRQELAFGEAAWVVNGLMFSLTHIWQPWIIIAILPSSLLLVYIVQKRRNTWIGIFQHGIVNSGLLLVLIGGVIG
jgi:membrane protease YdiL (CAAX protease family)